MAGLWGFSMILMQGSWFEPLGIHWQPLEASVGATPLLKPRLKPCQVSIVDTTSTEKNKHGVSCVKDGKFSSPWSLEHTNWVSCDEQKTGCTTQPMGLQTGRFWKEGDLVNTSYSGSGKWCGLLRCCVVPQNSNLFLHCIFRSFLFFFGFLRLGFSA